MKKVDIDKLKAIDGVIDVIYQNNQLQVIIGPDVAEVYKYFNSTDNNPSGSNTKLESTSKKKSNIWSRLIDFISGAFTPILPAIIGAGLLKGFIAIFNVIGILPTRSIEYILLSMIADACFYFLPILLAFSAAKKLDTNPYISAVLAGVLVHPTLIKLVTKGTALSFAGIPIKDVNYSSSVVPILLIVWFQSYIEKYLNKHLPKTIGLFVTPVVSIFVSSLIGLIVLGPIGSYVGIYLGMFISFLNNTAPWLAPTIMGAFSPLIVMMGMHYSLFPIAIQSISSFGYDSFFTPSGLVSNLAQSGAAFAVAVKSKEKVLRGTAISTGATAALGITEPVLYGVNLKLKKPLYGAVLGGAIGGLYIGLTRVTSTAIASPGILALALFAKTPTNLLNAIIGMIISFAISFGITMVIWKPKAVKQKDMRISSVTDGLVKNLKDVDDVTFSSGAMGKGMAFESKTGEVYSPVDGEIVMVFPTKHAYGIRSNSGIELLIHIGIDTVQLNGKYFKTNVNKGTKVHRGDKLGSFDIKEVQKAGYDTTIMLIITNTNDYDHVNTDVKYNTDVTSQQMVLTV
ncbi:PTS family porter [Companilactobacillus bobalius DSM 19674]|uniref:PTS family porter n=1 Tax=Companilactobacillus bobalius DSM 19674 TaxID=1423788 RepID=A0A0R1KVJ3_9LACO|nr:PTS family porter [Companilactobacillus bobalius DSM 19674]